MKKPVNEYKMFYKGFLQSNLEREYMPPIKQTDELMHSKRGFAMYDWLKKGIFYILIIVNKMH